MNLKTTAVTYLILLKFLPLNKSNVEYYIYNKWISFQTFKLRNRHVCSSI
jgi:hypothetical protein